jgi:hypothetical protein
MARLCTRRRRHRRRRLATENRKRFPPPSRPPQLRRALTQEGSFAVYASRRVYVAQVFRPEDFRPFAVHPSRFFPKPVKAIRSRVSDCAASLRSPRHHAPSFPLLSRASVFAGPAKCPSPRQWARARKETEEETARRKPTMRPTKGPTMHRTGYRYIPPRPSRTTRNSIDDFSLLPQAPINSCPRQPHKNQDSHMPFADSPSLDCLRSMYLLWG